MSNTAKTWIKGSGIFLADKVVKNEDFHDRKFYKESGERMPKEAHLVAQKLGEITGIKERRYLSDLSLNTSHIAAKASEDLFKNHPEIDKEKIDFIIVAHNFGEVQHGTNSGDLMPSVSTRVKSHLQIENPRCVPIDAIFGCPGWLQGFIMAEQILTENQTALVIGAEVISRMTDIYDPDSMLFGDGAGAVFVHKTAEENSGEVLIHDTYSHATTTWDYLKNGPSYHPDFKAENCQYIKMNGRRVFEYAVTYLSQLIIETLERQNLTPNDIDHMIMHQANERINNTIAKKVYEHFGQDVVVPPMTLDKFGNTSVASIPTLYHLMKHGEMGADHKIKPGDTILFASVGAGMYCNTAIYTEPK